MISCLSQAHIGACSWRLLAVSSLIYLFWRDMMELRHALDSTHIPILAVVIQKKQLGDVFELYSDVYLHVSGLA